MIKAALLAAALITGGCTLRFLMPEDKGYTILRKDEGQVIALLDNRLIVAARRMPAAPVASAQVWVETGSIFEQEFSGAGISHFLEHLLSGGSTTTRSESESNAILGRMGARKNAATGLESVYYYINSSSEDVLTSVDLLSDWMINATLPEEEFERERQVIQREISMGEGEPPRILWRLTQQARYGVHPARHPTIGYADEFLEITRDQVIDFYERMYAPNNMIFTVAGDIDPVEVVERVAENWRKVPARDLPEISFPVEPEPEFPGEVSGRADLRRPRIRLAWPGTRAGEEHDSALDLLAAVLGRGESSRLSRTVRDRDGLVTAVSSYNLSFHWGEGFFGIDAEPAPGEEDSDPAERAREAILAEVGRLLEEPVSGDELERARRNILSRILSANQNVQEAASRMARDTLAFGDPDYLFRYYREIREVTAEDVMRAARQYLKPERLITVRLLPETEEEKAVPLRRVPGPSPEEFPSEKVRMDNSRIIEKISGVSEDIRERAPAEVGPYRLTKLENGLRVITQRSTVVPAAAIHLYTRGGLLAEEYGREGYASAAAAMLTRGTEKYTALEFAEKVEGMGASVSASSGYNTDYIRARSLKEDWPEVMELVAEVFLRPAFLPEEWESLQRRHLAAIDRERDSWYGELTQRFRDIYFGAHPWSRTSLGRRETIEKITAGDISDFHYSRLGAADTVIVVTGDIDPDEAVEKARGLFGDLPETPSREYEIIPPELPEPGVERVRTSKPLTAVMSGFGPAIEHAHPDYPVMRVLSAVISDFPGGWLQQALRGDGPGLVYASWARMVTGLVPGFFEVTFNTSPEHLEEALERAHGAVRRAAETEVSSGDLERASAKVLFDEFFSRQSNSERASSAGLDEIYGIGDPGGDDFRKRVGKVTPEELREAAESYFKESFTVILSDR